MRVVFIALTILACSISLVSAAEMAAPVVAEVSGTVDSIDSILPETGDTEGSIIVRASDGTATTCIITPATIATDSASVKIGSDAIQDGDAVKVTYASSENGNVALTIIKTKK